MMIDLKVLNQGRVYDCGRVPPIPRKQRNRSRRADVDEGVDDSSKSPSGCFTLVQFLTASHTNHRRNSFSESGWCRRIERGQILVDGNVVKDPDRPLTQVKQRIEYFRKPWREPTLRVIADPGCFQERDMRGSQDEFTSAEHTLRILYIDDHLMAVHKPSGLPTMPSQTYFGYSVLNALRHLYQYCCDDDEKTIFPTNANVNATDAVKELILSHCSAPPQPVHRLGVGTSGILIIATSLLGRQRLTDAIRLKSHNNDSNNPIRKVYRALVYAHRCDVRCSTCRTDGEEVNALIPDFMTIDCPIGSVPFPIGGDTIHAACPTNNDSLYGHVHPHNGEDRDFKQTPSLDSAYVTKHKIKPALSYVRVVRRNASPGRAEKRATAVVEVEIPTGRPHQIRIHLAYAGYPLVDDPLYLPGGIPDAKPRLFESRKKEEEDLETDDDEKNDSSQTARVPLPRDTGYNLHAYQITLEHPICSEKGTGLQLFTAPAPPLLR